MQRTKLLMNGLLQGVGFRPHAYRCAIALGLTGFVRNSSQGIELEVQGQAIEPFIEQLSTNLPPGAYINDMKQSTLEIVTDEQGFEILTSTAGQHNTELPPDKVLCDACLSELFDPESRFYLYPFISCSHCGPRYSIAHDLPCDRDNTTMSDFPLCVECSTQYHDPLSRRFHAQPMACHHCGPSYSHSIKKVAENIIEGKIVAIKAIGGYQLICDAEQQAAVEQLRHRKNRPTKPLALMHLNTASIEKNYHCDAINKKLLLNEPRPITLLPVKHSSPRNQLIAPGLTHHGIMLPYTAMHYLLFYYLLGEPSETTWLQQATQTDLVVTSANVSGAPIIMDQRHAEEELSNIADCLVHHSRKIIAAVDDPVVRTIHQQPIWLRQARGFSPRPIQLAQAQPSVLALGATLKHTFCLTKANQAYVSPHLGTMNHPTAIERLHQSLEHYCKLFNIQPQMIAHDQHPDMVTTQLAQRFDLPTIAIQHHHAHIAAVMAEHHLREPVLGWALDGFGYGEHGEAWGGELLLIDGKQMTHLASLPKLALAGGDKAAKEPWRMGAALLHYLGLNHAITDYFPQQSSAPILAKWLIDGTQAYTSSCGRLFDGVAALLGLCSHHHYEAEAAMRLESLVTEPEIDLRGWEFVENQINLKPLLQTLLTLDPVDGANRFHGTLAAALMGTAAHFASKLNINKLILGGGCIVNKALTESLIKYSQQHSINVYIPLQLPPNDASISLGQAWLAGHP